MKLAVLAVTVNGAVLAQKLADKLTAQIFVKKGRSDKNAEVIEFEHLSDIMPELFRQYDGLIFIMAAGIVVRTIAPLVSDKRYDPAIVAMDEKGRFAISLLSGHLGGANELAEMTGQAIGAVPVITTATDVNELAAADMIAKRLHLTIEPFGNLRSVNSLLAAHRPLQIYLDEAMADCSYYEQELRKYFSGKPLQQQTIIKAELSADFVREMTDANVLLITDKLYHVNNDQQLLMRPRGAALGIGCKRGMAVDALQRAVKEACKLAGVRVSEIELIGSTVVKSDEAGLLELAEQMKVPLKFFDNRQLNDNIEKYNLEISPFVKKQIGVGNVCEASALQISQSKKLILHKTKLQGITAAMAWVR